MHPGQLALLHIPIDGKPLATYLHRPYEVLEKKETVNYVISTPERRKKTLLVHIIILRYALVRLRKMKSRRCPSTP